MLGSLPLEWGSQAAVGQGAASWPTSMFSPISEEALLGGRDMTKLGMLAAAGWGPEGREEWRWEAEKRLAQPWAGVGDSGPALDSVLVLSREPGWVGLPVGHRMGIQEGSSGLGWGSLWATWSMRGPWAVKRSQKPGGRGAGCTCRPPEST